MRDTLDLWKVLYADTGGYLVLFSGGRSGTEPGRGSGKETGKKPGKLMDTRTRYFHYPVANLLFMCATYRWSCDDGKTRPWWATAKIRTA